MYEKKRLEIFLVLQQFEKLEERHERNYKEWKIGIDRQSAVYGKKVYFRNNGPKRKRNFKFSRNALKGWRNLLTEYNELVSSIDEYSEKD